MIANSTYIAENLNSFKSFLQELDKNQAFKKTRSLEEHNEIAKNQELNSIGKNTNACIPQLSRLKEIINQNNNENRL
ncbi:unnamed protein product [Brachionus calyciflorus]|uniref:Uncharacterized protein n=1 Tax=Brachionus calyciflorus TaxID=104777 RepID=A0A814MZ48_9BILA|nr:unnamed protein product [Brachionus calyciflorus]